MHRLQELVRLHRMGEDSRAVARQLKMGPNTERSYRLALKAAGLLQGSPDELPAMELLRTAVEAQRPPRAAPHEISSIERWASAIKGWVEKGLEPKAIFDRLRQEQGEHFDGSYWAVKRLCRRLRKARGVTPESIPLRVETEPGEVAQVDFGEVGKLYDPHQNILRRAWVFVMVLGYSRHIFAKVVFDQRTETWLALHVEAFAFFGGVPKVIVPDNLKAAVIRAAFTASQDPSLNRSYRELARHYGFKIDPTPAYAPQKKGKVESAVKYVKNNALAGRDEEDVDLVNTALTRWVLEIAGTRMHGTTGMAPLEVFASRERPALLTLPTKRWEPVLWKRAKVHADVHVSFERALYSVPWRLQGQEVWVRGTATSVTIHDAADQRVATHRRVKPGTRTTTEEHLPEGRRDLRHRSRGYWEERAMAIGPEVATLVKEVFDSDDVLSQLRAVQAIVTYLEKYPTARARAACERARFFGNYSYAGVKRILTQALDLEPLPVAMVPASSTSPSFRFARNVSELMSTRMEVPHEPQ